MGTRGPEDLGETRPHGGGSRRWRWVWQYLLTFVALAAVAAAVLLPLRYLQGQRPDTTRQPTPGYPVPPAEVRWEAVPDQVVEACRRAGRRADFAVLCPRELPERTAPCIPDGSPIPAGEPGCPAAPKAVVLLDGADVQGVELGYSAPFGAEPALNRPSRFLHFAVLLRGRGFGRLEQVGRKSELGRALGTRTIGGHRGKVYFVEVSGYHHEHLVFVWRSGASRYVATLHTWDDEEQAIRVLDRLVAALRRPPALGPR